MPLAPNYPVGRYEPSPLVDLSAKAERERLSPAAIKAFFNIMARWQVRDEDARALLGGDLDVGGGQQEDLVGDPLHLAADAVAEAAREVDEPA